MQSQANQPGPANPYCFAPSLDSLRDVPLASWSAKAFSLQWNDRVVSGLEVDLRQALDNMVSGSIKNNTGVDLINCRLFYNRWSYKLPDIRDSTDHNIDPKLEPRSLRGVLTATSYAPSATDTAPILDMIMFHKTAGGESFTRLSNHYQSRLDMTNLLALDRAILITQIATPSATEKADANSSTSCESSSLLLNDQPLPKTQISQQTFYRFVLPVQSVKNNE